MAPLDVQHDASKPYENTDHERYQSVPAEQDSADQPYRNQNTNAYPPLLSGDATFRRSEKIRHIDAAHEHSPAIQHLTICGLMLS